MSLTIKVKKKFKGFNLDVDIDSASDKMSIMGPSGSGKSMTLRCIAGLIRPDSGIVKVGDEVLFDSEKKIDKKPKDRKVGFLFQNYALFPNMNVRKNIEFGIHKDDKEGLRLVDELAEKFKISDLMSRKPHQLSGGQQQRVALARVVAPRPQILLLDEPFSALDEHLKLSLMKDMSEAVREFSLRTVFVTHNVHEAYRMGEELAIYKSGEIITGGNKDDIFNFPPSSDVARITGCKNILEAEFVSAGADVNIPSIKSGLKVKEVKAKLPSLGAELKCINAANSSSLPGEGIVIIRANHIDVSEFNENESLSENTFIAEVLEAFTSPFRVTLYLKIGGSEIIKAEIARDSWESIAGDRVIARIPMEKAIYV